MQFGVAEITTYILSTEHVHFDAAVHIKLGKQAQDNNDKVPDALLVLLQE